MAYLRRFNPAVTSLRPDCYDEATLAGVAARAGIPLWRDTDEQAAAAAMQDRHRDATWALASACFAVEISAGRIARYRDVAREYRSTHPDSVLVFASTRRAYAGMIREERRQLASARFRVAAARGVVEALS